MLERKDLSRLDGAEAFRVYEFLPEQEKHDSDEIYPRHLWSKVSYRTLTRDSCDFTRAKMVFEFG